MSPAISKAQLMRDDMPCPPTLLQLFSKKETIIRIPRKTNGLFTNLNIPIMPELVQRKFYFYIVGRFSCSKIRLLNTVYGKNKISP